MSEYSVEEIQAQARRAVRHAISTGRLVRPSVCSKCGNAPGFARDGRTLIQGHHADHTRKLDVEWLCVYCHAAETPHENAGGAPSFGQSNGKARLSEESVHMIRLLHKQGRNLCEIARRAGVDRKTIRNVVKGITWKGVGSLGIGS